MPRPKLLCKDAVKKTLQFQVWPIDTDEDKGGKISMILGVGGEDVVIVHKPLFYLAWGKNIWLSHPEMCKHFMLDGKGI